MAERKPVVLVGGQLKELPAGDTLPPQAPEAHVHTTSDVTGLGAALDGKEPTISAGTTAQYWRGDKSWQPLNKSAVGLGNVDNTSDANKPISTAQQAALNAKQDALVSGTNIKTVGGQSLLGTGNVQLGDFLYGELNPDHGDGNDGDVYIQSDGKLWSKGSGVWTYTGIQFTANSVTLTDAAATATLPDTAAAPVASRLQVLRNNVKQAFADLAGKADDTAVVKLTGTQTVDGIKTFTSRSVHAGAYTASAQPAHSATPTFDCATSNVFEPATMTGNVTSITLSNAVAGQTVQIRFQQDATGGRTVAVPSGAKVDGSINTGANRVSWLILTYSSRGSRWEGNWLVIPS